MAQRKRRNTIDPVQTHAVVSALIGMKSVFEKQPMTADGLARCISDKVGFVVTRGNVYNTAIRLGYSFSENSNWLKSGIRESLLAAALLPPGARNPDPTPPEPNVRLGKSVFEQLTEMDKRLDRHGDDLAALDSRATASANYREEIGRRVEQLEGEVAMLRQHLVRIYNDLGVPFPIGT